MPNLFTVRRAAALVACLAPLFAAPSFAADGEIIITHAKALAGGVTPGDAPGYPVTITAPGSYKLGGNLQAPPGKNGIDANAVEVTIDLNGFRINGDKTGTIQAYGVRGSQRNLQVRNGTIRNFSGSGVYAGHGLIVRDMNISENSMAGVEFDARSGYGRIVNNTIMQNMAGIYCSVACQIAQNVISGNKEGVLTEKSALLLGNTIMNNAAYGVWIPAGAKVAVGNNTIADNGSVGQIVGIYTNLHPNACAPTACP